MELRFIGPFRSNSLRCNREVKAIRYLLLILLLVGDPSQSWLLAQNLVPNPSFELYNQCPIGLGNIPTSPTYTNFPVLAAWVSPIATTPDYYHACNGSGIVSVPQNLHGYQNTTSGFGYAGIVAFTSRSGGSIYSEYIETKLTSPLIPGRVYHVQFFCSPATFPTYNNYKIVGIDGIGAKLSSNQITGTGSSLSMSPSVASPRGSAIVDTNIWTRVGGIYIPTAAEEWLTIGRFFDTGAVTQGNIVTRGTITTMAYYYLDDVSVQDMASPSIVRVNNVAIPCGVNSVQLNGPVGGNDYYWNNGSTNTSINVMQPGTWWVYSRTGASYAIDTFKVTRAGGSSILALQQDTLLCPGTTYTIRASGAYYTYLWNTGATTPTITVSQPGRYILRTTDFCGPQYDTIVLSAPPTLNLPGDTAICTGTSITIQSNIPFPSYTWSNGATTRFNTIRQEGTYVLTVNGLCGLQIDSVTLTYLPITPVPLTRDTIICQYNTSPQLKVVGNSLKWYTSPTSASVPAQPSVNTSNIGQQTFYVTQTQNGCESERKPVKADVIVRPYVSLGPDTTVCKGHTFLLGGNYKFPDVSVRWSTGENYSPIQVTRSGYYQLTATNMCGSSTDYIYVILVDCDSNINPVPNPGFDHNCLIIPNAYTPNGDGRNDRFVIGTRCKLEYYNIRIYNRWGEMIYESHSLTSPWDGTYKGQPAPTGTYFYMLSYLVAGSGNVYDKMKGDILLIR